MTNSETIEKLNEALNQLIDAYEILQNKNNDLENEINTKNDIINDLEDKLNEENGHKEIQSNKMDGMLSRIQSLLTNGNSKDEVVNSDENGENINLKIEDESKSHLKMSNSNSNENTNKIDLGRMESLLNGLNTK